ncbi:ribonucleoside-diphosphate reductase subunit alpha [Alkalihalobacillus sp. AL-G]|uniref:ribonucleoside-diphosphate reductase subunit alpha n=1 Tax=Alkalihalobacillus sp. AL-G TaxID=2926399 RepID=UPI00272BCA44|nr:ribonucleoside-diphosphate reductase subunit alpha [Alkalihalobacillus sp. AL-G]WLD93215.1 ribonucleoside-diphosphate reductase subunit alpha [Alkalihalobacillus sp. AL-G]
MTTLPVKKEISNELQGLLEKLTIRFPELDVKGFSGKVIGQANETSIQGDLELLNQLILNGLSNVTQDEPGWTYVCAGFYSEILYREAAENRKKAMGYGDFYGLIEQLVAMKIYDPTLLEAYSREAIDELESIFVPSRDEQFTYAGLRMLADRYLARDHDGRLYELPQERWMIIAMTLMIPEPEPKRLKLVKEAYWALSNLYMTVATPTLANAGKAHGQLSSCFIDTVDDSLRGIYDSNTDIAMLSKAGGGIGVYLGKIRSKGSDIRGFKNTSSGVLAWMKQLNTTAVNVDQLGQRNGAIAVYYPVFGKDIFPFLDAKLNNGDERQRTHDLFTGVAIPDLFMEKVENREEWNLFDPHEVKNVMGFELDDFYDEEKGKGSFREKYEQCVSHPLLSRECVPAIEIMKRIMVSQLETGGPFMFYKDTVNRWNTNRHEGIIYCTNLCTEITQNQSPTIVEEETTVDGKIIVTKQPGDFVVCNLSSLSLARVVEDDVLKRVIPVQVRMLDNVIDLNSTKIEVKQAVQTNEKYRAIGLGTFGWHHLLAKQGIRWESEEAVVFADRLYEDIHYLTVKASVELAAEKRAYPVFKGSDWESGRYFENRGYTSIRWKSVQEKLADTGIRNGWLLAVAPNASTSIIAGSTASIDPIFRKQYAEEKKSFKIPVTAPDLSAETTWYYKSAYDIDQKWSIRQNAARQRHIDQSVSFNLYVRHDIKAKDLLDLHLSAWQSGLKTTYYVRSTSQEDFEGCDSCES